MYANGTALFGNRWSATMDQQRRWNALAAASARMQVEAEVDDDERGD